MRVGILSDIHSNLPALKAVSVAMAAENVDECWILGDFFGYYPWAPEVYHQLRNIPLSYAVLGNHDSFVLGEPSPNPTARYLPLAKHNAQRLAIEAPGALEWLRGLPRSLSIEAGGRRVRIVHGTPDEPIHGRYYPDDDTEYDWLPGSGEVLIVGQTHYSMVRERPDGGLVLNPGSVGQPRDGDPRSAWMLLELPKWRVQVRRTPYNHYATIAALERMDWDPYVSKALNKPR